MDKNFINKVLEDNSDESDNDNTIPLTYTITSDELIFNPYNGELEKKYTLPGVPASPPIIVKQDIFLMFKNASIFSIK